MNPAQWEDAVLGYVLAFVAFVVVVAGIVWFEWQQSAADRAARPRVRS